jgi:hypothetical protein
MVILNPIYAAGVCFGAMAPTKCYCIVGL